MIISSLILLASSAAVPLGQERWHSNLDYPDDARSAGAEGTTEYEILVGSDGRPKKCDILKSAGHRSLDATTCKIVLRRARWKPAHDEAGQPMEVRFKSHFTWTIPC